MAIYIKRNEFSSQEEALSAAMHLRCRRCQRALKYQAVNGGHYLLCIYNEFHRGMEEV